MSSETLSDAEALRALERFVVESDDLVDLETRIGRFNIFDALGIVNAEIRHSNFLAWLLDPNESHGAGSIFLRAVLMDLLRETPPDARPLSPIDLDGEEIGSVEVRREWRSIDLLILLEKQKVAVVIENKVLSGEHSDQLTRYAEITKRELSDYSPFFVYLTPEGNDASDDGWTSYDYAGIHRALSRCRNLYDDSVGDEVGVFLDQYLSLIGSRFMQSEEIQRLVDRIYKNHRQALDLIFEQRGDPRVSFAAEVESLIQKDWLITHRGKGFIGFVPPGWQSWLPALRPKKTELPWIHMALSADPDRVILYMIVAPSKDEQLRAALVESIKEHGAEVGFKVNKKHPTSKWTRVFSQTVKRQSGGLDYDDERLLEKTLSAIDQLGDRVPEMESFLRTAIDQAKGTA